MTEINKSGLRNLNGQPLSLHGLETILKNPFYTGVIEVKRTGETYQGIHKPIISASLFKRVQDIRSGRCGPKRTRHDHLFRGLFRCGLCDRPMTPELQKGSVYYRCQEKDCQTKTVREDVLDLCIRTALKKCEITKDKAELLAKKWEDGLDGLACDNTRISLQLRIDATEKSLSRADDLLINGTLDETTYLAKKREAHMTLAELREELRKLPNPTEVAANNAQFIELIKNLAGLYEYLKPAEKRVFIENTFSNRTVVGKKPCFETYPWLHNTDDGLYVPSGEPSRYTDRTFGPPETIKRLFERYSEDLEKD